MSRIPQNFSAVLRIGTKEQRNAIDTDGCRAGRRRRSIPRI
jgi:hypothetical protein